MVRRGVATEVVGGGGAFGALVPQQLEEQRCSGPCPASTLWSSLKSRIGRGTHRALCLHGALFQVPCPRAEAEEKDGGHQPVGGRPRAGALLYPSGRGKWGGVMATLDGQLRKAHLGLSLAMCRMRRLDPLSSEFSSHTALV